MNELLNIVLQTINYYLEHKKIPTSEQLEIWNLWLLKQKWCVFVTLYKKWEIRGSAWNIKEIEPSIIEETIKSTIDAISNDKRFTPLLLAEVKELKIRVDYIKERKPLTQWIINTIDPLQSWIVVINKDYDSLAVILPNISPKLMTWEDFKIFLEAKLNNKFDENDYYIYEIKTDILTNY